jgi:hypothetical protein
MKEGNRSDAAIFTTMPPTPYDVVKIGFRGGAVKIVEHLWDHFREQNSA